VATPDRFTGDGTTILDAANYMVGENSNPQSIFFRNSIPITSAALATLKVRGVSPAR